MAAVRQRHTKCEAVGNLASEGAGQASSVNAPWSGEADESRPPSPSDDTTSDRLERLAAVGVVLLGAALRFYRLPFQPGLNFDEAANGFDILAVLQGQQHPIFFAANRGREPLFIYWQSLFVAMLGLSPFTLRLAAAFVGVLVVAATCFAAAQILSLTEPPKRARRVALLAAFVVATGYWPIVLSRVGLRAITLPLFELLAFGFLWRGLRDDRWRDFALAGLCGGLAMYTYFSSRLLPILPALLCLAALATAPSRRRLGQFVLMAAVWAVVFAPLGVYYLRHADDATSRIEEVSILNPQHGGDQPLRALAGALRTNARMLAVEVSDLPPQAFSGRAALDPAAALLLWLGLAVAGWRALRPRQPGVAALARPRACPLPAGADAGPSQPVPATAQSGPPAPLARSSGAGSWPKAATAPPWTAWGRLPSAFVLAWLAVMVVPSVLAIDAPHYMRAIGALPALALLVALGASQIVCWSEALGRRAAGWALVLALLAASAALNYRDCFVAWLPSETAYYQLMAEKVEAARLIGEWTSGHRVLLAPLYYQDYTVRLVAREQWPKVQTFDPGAPAMSAVEPTLYVFPAIDEEQPRELLQRLGPAARLETVLGSNHRPLLNVVRLDPGPREDANPPLATLEGLIALSAVRIEPAAVAPGGALRVSLTWRALQRSPENYSVFVHLRDRGGRTIAQKDGYPGKGAFPTLWWQPGDRVLDEYELTVPPDAPLGEYRVVVGMYRLETMKRLELVAGGKRADGDELSIGVVSVVR